MADSSFRRAEMQDRQRVSRCPYCVEGGAFKEMKPVEAATGKGALIAGIWRFLRTRDLNASAPSA